MTVPEHVLCFAPTRSGKGVGLVVPTLLVWPGSAIVHDIKGENSTLDRRVARALRPRAFVRPD
jgi:type IV secretory pathway TraG/TraD family ATPase VirD4